LNNPNQREQVAQQEKEREEKAATTKSKAQDTKADIRRMMSLLRNGHFSRAAAIPLRSKSAISEEEMQQVLLLFPDTVQLIPQCDQPPLAAIDTKQLSKLIKKLANGSAPGP